MNISYEFQLRAAESGHRWSGYQVTDSDEAGAKAWWVVACLCGWKAAQRDPSGSLSDPLITWADHVLTDTQAQAAERIQIK